jgi:transposase
MAKKGQTYTPYTEELKRKVVRLKLEEGCSYRQLRGRFDIQSDAQIAEWVRKVQNKEAFEDHCGIWNRKQFFGHRRGICHDNKLLFSFIPVKLISLIFPFPFLCFSRSSNLSPKSINSNMHSCSRRFIRKALLFSIFSICPAAPLVSVLMN